MIDALRGAAQGLPGVAKVRVAADVWFALEAALSTPYLTRGFDASQARLCGFPIEIDERLPRGVWRLCDAVDTLLYDCREGTSPR